MRFLFYFLGSLLPIVAFTSDVQPSFHSLVALVQADNKTKDTAEVNAGNAILIQTVKGFLSLLGRGGIDQAYYGNASKEFQEETSLRDFKVFVNSYPPLARYRDSTILQVEHTDRLASVDVDAWSVDQYHNVVSIDAIFESGRWRILGIQMHPPLPKEP